MLALIDRLNRIMLRLPEPLQPVFAVASVIAISSVLAAGWVMFWRILY